MTAPNATFNLSATVSAASGPIAIGDAVVPIGGVYYKATAANLATAAQRAHGMATSAWSSSATGSVAVQHVGIIDAAQSGLAAGAASWVRVSAAGRLERCTPAGADDVVGYCAADGTLFALFGSWTATIINGGGGGGGATLPIDLTTDVSGILAEANGGTGSATLPAGGLAGLTALASGDAASVATAAADATTKANAAQAAAIAASQPLDADLTAIASAGLAAGMATWIGSGTSADLATALTDETGSGSCVFGTAPLFKTTINLNNPANTFKYVITPAAIVADRILNLPLLAATDTVAVLAMAQTLTNKTIAGASNTLTVRIANDVSGLGAGVATALATFSSANIKTACTDETGSGGALVFATSPTIDAPTLSGLPVLSGASASTSNNAKGTTVDVNPVNVQTTDATVTTLDSFTIASNSAVTVSWLVTAIKSDSSQAASYSVSACFKNAAGTAAQVGTTTVTVLGESDSAWDCTADNSTTTIRLRVTGKAATTVQWTAILTRLTVIP